MAETSDSNNSSCPGQSEPAASTTSPKSLKLRAVTLHFPDIHKSFLNTYNAYRLKGELCDLTLIAENKEFPVHRLCMATASEYLNHKLLSNEAKGRREPRMEIEGVTASALDALISHVYTGDLHVDMRSVNDIRTGATILGMKSVIDICDKYLEELENNQ